LEISIVSVLRITGKMTAVLFLSQILRDGIRGCFKKSLLTEIEMGSSEKEMCCQILVLMKGVTQQSHGIRVVEPVLAVLLGIFLEMTLTTVQIQKEVE
jgi:hypothetical protein